MARTSGACSAALRAKSSLLVEDVGEDELSAVVGDFDVGVVDGREAEQDRAVDEGQEVVDFEHEVVGECGEVLASAACQQELEEAGHAADGRGREWLFER